jgi:hypothetical protein
LTGDTTKALYWFRNEPIGDYDNKASETLVAQGHGEALRLFLLEQIPIRLDRVNLL